MVEILSRGTPQSERTYVATCRGCGSMLQFKAKEADLTFDQRDGDFVSIPCPVCSATVTKDAYGYERPRGTMQAGEGISAP